MALSPYKPFNVLFPAIDQVFDNLFTGNLPDHSAANFRGPVPAVNIRETNVAYEIELAAPGLNKEDFHLEVENDFLKISAQKETKTDEKEAEGKYHRKEFGYHSFQRSFALPKNVEVDKVGAAYTDGILKVNLPKPVAAQAKATKRIEIL